MNTIRWRRLVLPGGAVAGSCACAATEPGAASANGSWWSFAPAWLTAELFQIGGVPVTALALLRAVAIIAIAWWLSRLGRGALTQAAKYRANVNAASLYTLQRMLHYVIVTVGFFVGLSSVGIDLSKFALFASALGVGVGFGLQNLIGNFVAGLLLLFERTLKVGDFIELESGLNGEVREINFRSTLVTTNDNIDVVVPNSIFVNGLVKNWTMREVSRRLRVPFGVAYGSDLELVRQAGLEAADAVGHTLAQDGKYKPQVWLTAFGDSSLNFELVVWLHSDAVKRPGSVQATYLWALHDALVRHKLEIPFPQRDLHIRSWAAEAGVPVPSELRAAGAQRSGSS